MGGDAGSMLGNVAGRVLGVLSALPSRGGGFSNLANYMAARQRAMSDPSARAALTPFGAGFYQIGGGMQPGPGSYAPVASPADFMGPTLPTAAGPSEFIPGRPVWKADLPPLAPEAALQQEAHQRTLAGLQSPDVVTRARAKQDAKIPLTSEEQDALVGVAREVQRGLPEGSSATVGPGGITYTIGSRYTLPPGAVQTPAQFEMPLEQLQPQLLPGQVPHATGRTNAQGQPLYRAVTPPTVPKPDLRPPTLNLPGAPPAGVAPGAPPAAPPPPQPGQVDLSSSFFRRLEAERGLPPGVLSGIAEKESGGYPLRKSEDPKSSASGLFQITRDTARAWGISANDRFDPVKSAIATADTLAARAKEVGIERAVGMHYGGPGAAWGEVVGTSGLSPARYAADVFRRTQKYVNVGGTAYAAEPPPTAAPPPPPPAAPPAVVAPAAPPAPPPAAAPVVTVPSAPPAAVVPTAPPPAPPPAAAPPPAVVTAAPSPAPQELVGYPPPAPAVPSVTVPTGIALPPETGVQLVTPAAPTPVRGPGGMPLETVTQQSQAGETATYKAPEDLAAAQREAVMKQEVERLRGAGTAEDQKVLNSLYNYRTKLAELKTEFPTPADREPWVGKPARQWMARLGEYVQEPEKKRVAFQGAVAPFSLKAFETSGATMSDNEEAMILPNLPHGQEASATRFEDKLGRFEDGLEAAIAFRTTIARLPVEQRTPEVLNEVQRQVMVQQQARRAAREEAAGAPPAAVVAAPPAPPAPPATPPPTVVVPPSPPTVVVPPPPTAPTAAVAEPSAAPGVLFPKRSFWSQAPSIGGAITGGLAGASIGAPFLPPIGPIVGGLIGAGLGGGIGEGVQLAGERYLGEPTAETGTAAERTGRAAARGVVGEAVGAPLRVGSWMLASQIGPVAKAAKDLAPVLAQDLPAGTKAVEAAGGGFRNIGRLLKDPTELAAAELTPEGQQTMLRAWWGNMATKKPEKIVAAWDALEPEGQAALAGAQHGAMETVIDTLRAGASPLEWGKLLTGGSIGTALGVVGHPGVGAAIAAAPAAAELAQRTVPAVAAPMLLSPAGAAVLGGLPRVAQVAGPMVGIPYRAATQAGTTMLWPQPAP